jgi:cobalt/nickel transport system permease protein
MSKTSLSKHIPDLTYMTMVAEMRKSWLHSASPWTKLFMLFLGIFLIVVIDNLILILILYFISLVIYLTAHLPVKKLKNWYSLPLLIAITIAIPLALNEPGQFMLFYFNLGWFEVYLSDIGIQIILLIIFRSLFSVTISFSFIMTTKYKELAYVLHRLFPKRFADILLLTYRYIFLMMDEIGCRINALRSRGGSFLGYSANLKNFGNLIGGSIINSVERGTRLAKAMEIRGGGSETIYIHEPVKKFGIMGLIIICFVVFSILVIILFGANSLINWIITLFG